MRLVDMDKAMDYIRSAEEHVYKSNPSPFTVAASGQYFGIIKDVLYRLLTLCEVKEE